MARAWEDLGRLPEAESALRQASDSTPYAWSPLNMLGSFYLRHARFADAESSFRRALRITPDNTALYTNLGISLQRQWRSGEASAAFRKSLDIAPSYPAWLNLGNVQYAARDFAGAEESYEKALQLNSRDFRVWGTRAQALRLAGRPADETCAAYRRAIALAEDDLRLNPSQPRTLSLLGIYYAALKDAPASVERLQAALAAAGSDRQVFVDAAIAYGLLGQPSQAVTWAERALAAGEPWQDLHDDPDLQPLIRSGALKRPHTRPHQQSRGD
jgi:serine/threonine-protein kinase